MLSFFFFFSISMHKTPANKKKLIVPAPLTLTSRCFHPRIISVSDLVPQRGNSSVSAIHGKLRRFHLSDCSHLVCSEWALKLSFDESFIQCVCVQSQTSQFIILTHTTCCLLGNKSYKTNQCLSHLARPIQIFAPPVL